MGTPEFARVCLQALFESEHNVVAVVTQPDRPAGRGKKPKISDVKAYAQDYAIPVLQPEKVSDPDFITALTNFNAHIFVVAAFGQILPQRVLDIPKFGAINVHASLLPRLRGAAPIQRAILDGETTTGITIMQMDAGMDTGDMLLRRPVDIYPTDTAGKLHDKLCQIAPVALFAALKQIVERRTKPTPQDHSKATYAPMIKKDEARIYFNMDTRQIINTIRAFNPRPGAYAEILGKDLKIWHAIRLPLKPEEGPGHVRLCPKFGIFVTTADAELQIMEVTPPGGKKMAAAEYVRGLK
jgi:methionyl-tRNA formyltransferase